MEMGAEYAVTQLFYDNRKYFDFVERARQAGVTIPIIPGIKPFQPGGRGLFWQKIGAADGGCLQTRRRKWRFYITHPNRSRAKIKRIAIFTKNAIPQGFYAK